jgi:hypothetical protein
MAKEPLARHRLLNRVHFLRNTTSTRQLDFSQVLSEEFLQFGRSGNDERVAFDAQQFAVTEFCQRA